MKKLISGLLCLTLLIALFTGCISAGASTLESLDWDTHETFTYWLHATPNDFFSSYSDSPITRYLNNKFNVTLEFEQPPAGSESDALSMMFGTKAYTDAIDMTYYMGSIAELYSDGVIIDIAQYLDYMPNFSQRLAESDGFRKACYNDNGEILMLRVLSDESELRWGGLVYRRDILDTMTGGHVSFPSGNDEPTTIEDWEYMLPLYKMYFEAAGMVDSAPLILPYNGYFVMGELVSGFGVNPGFYLDNGTVKYGPMEQGFYNYLLKMKEWYDAGYIYRDFASRVNDLFYLPNTNLTYGGAAGAWFGLSAQLGDVMSMPDYGLFFNVKAAANPIDVANGITEAYPFGYSLPYDQSSGVAITSACKNIPKLLAVLDYMYTDEGGMMRAAGLTAEQAAGDPVYEAAGLQDGMYTLEDGVFTFNPITTAGGGTLDAEPFIGNRFPAFQQNRDINLTAIPIAIEGNNIWNAYKDGTSGIGKLPNTLSRPEAEDKVFTSNITTITDYVNAEVPKFIMGTTTLDENTFAAFVNQIKAYGIEESLRMQQEAYDRYLSR